jgi:hypothetical protein
VPPSAGTANVYGYETELPTAPADAIEPARARRIVPAHAERRRAVKEDQTVRARDGAQPGGAVKPRAKRTRAGRR